MIFGAFLLDTSVVFLYISMAKRVYCIRFYI